MKAVLVVLGLLILASCAQEEPSQDTTTEVPAQQTETPPFPPADDQGRPVYTMADVESRSSQDDCWTAIRGEVFDLTEWIARHPGGSRAIVNLCGTDGTAAFEGQHGGRASPEARLDDYVIGTLG
ncbi:MAG: cytochrome b5 domain-containing protein [Candidatus Woesearchaeota archaeon]